MSTLRLTWLFILVAVLTGCAKAPTYTLTPADKWTPSTNVPAEVEVKDVAPYRPSYVAVSSDEPKDISDQGEAPTATVQKISIPLPERE